MAHMSSITTETDHTAAAKAAVKTSKQKPLNLKFPKLIFKWAKPFRGTLALVAALTVASAIVGMVVPYTFAVVIDGVQSGWTTRKVILNGISLTLGALLLRSVLESWSAIVRLRKLETVMLWHFRKCAAEAVCRLSVGQTQSENSGFRQSLLSRGINAADQVVYLTLHDLWPLLGQTTIVSAALFLTTPWWLALATFAIGALQVTYRVWVNARQMPTLNGLSRDETRLEKGMSEFLRHVNIAQLNSQERRLLHRHDERRHEFMGREIGFWVRHVWRMLASDLVAIVGRCALFGLAAWLAAEGELSAGMFLVYVTWSGQLLAALDRFGQIFRMFARNLPHVTRLEAMLSIEPAVRLPANPYRPAEDISGHLEFRNVRFTYPEGVSFEDREDGVTKGEEERSALAGVSFSVRPGERVALVGKSGAGKSTVAQLIGRAYDPDGGEILIDGVDIRAYDLEWLRSRIGYVEQDVTLFDGTVGENLAMAVGGHVDMVANLDLVLSQSRVSDFLPRLGEKGLNAKIGERGIKLSGGQRQRLGIARALAKRPKFLVFDEATASLDAENEKGVYEAIFGEGLSGITAIIIAHNLRTIRRADRIVFFDGGVVAATGTHEELMRSCEQYRSLVEMHDYD